jgi:hypothetical protein
VICEVSFATEQSRIALNTAQFTRIRVAFANFNRTCTAMDFDPNATPARLAIGEIRIHVYLHHPIQSRMVHA